MKSPEIPLPSEAVTPVTVSQLAGLTPSAALESLIQQNIDLTTRLNINLRRVADMERIVQNLTAQNQNFETQKDAFREEIQVLHKRFQAQESKLLNYRLEKENAEKAYATLVIEHRSLKSKLEADKISSQKAADRIAKFRYKIHHHIRPLLKSVQADSDLLPLVQDELRRYKRYRSRTHKIVRPMVRNLKFQLTTYRDRCERLEVKTTELSQRIEELLNHLRTRSEQFESDQKKLVSYHEDRWSETNAKLEKTAADFESMKARYDAIFAEKEKTEEANVVLHNRSITAERRLEEVEQRYQSDIENLQSSLAKFETLWNEISQKLDITTVQLEAAQRLNTTLTEDLRQEREKNEQLNARIRQLKIKEVAKQSVKNAEPLLTANPEVPQQIIEDAESKNQISINTKLESLFAEIESGDLGQGHLHDNDVTSS